MRCPGETADILMAESECVLSGQCARGWLCRSRSPFPSKGVALRRGEQSSLPHLARVSGTCSTSGPPVPVLPACLQWRRARRRAGLGLGRPLWEAGAREGVLELGPKVVRWLGQGAGELLPQGRGLQSPPTRPGVAEGGTGGGGGTASVLPGGPCCPQTEAHTVAGEAVVRPAAASALQQPRGSAAGTAARPLWCVLG